jgi:hypothetical protein
MKPPVSIGVLPSPSAPVWNQLSLDRQRQVIGLMAQLAVKLVITQVQSASPEVHHDASDPR